MTGRGAWLVTRGWAVVAGLAALAATAGCQGEGEAVEDEAEQAAPDHVAQRIDALATELELDDQQRQQLEAAADLVRERHQALVAERPEHVERVLAAIEAGEFDEAEVHGLIDQRIDEVRATVHGVADELMALVESMDADQRARLVERLRAAHERMAAFHERLGSGEGHRAFVEHLRGRLCSGEGPIDELLGAE